MIIKNENNNRATVPPSNMEQNSGDESLAEKGFKGFTSQVCIKVISYRKLNHDTDGVSIKAVLDGVVHAGICYDDSAKQIKKICFESFKTKKGEPERTVIIIEEAEEDEDLSNLRFYKAKK